MTTFLIVLGYIVVFVFGWAMGASKASCPPVEPDYQNPKETSLNAQEAILEHLEKQDEVADTIQVGFRKRASTDNQSAYNEIYRKQGIIDDEVPMQLIVNKDGVILDEFEYKGNITESEAYVKAMAEYIILKNSWELKQVGKEEIKIVGGGQIITKQLTKDIYKWIVDNYEPNGTLKPIQESNENQN